MSIRNLYLFAAAAAILGCAPASNPSIPGVHRNAKVLTAEEIEAAHADVRTAYDAVARLRPNWLASHGAMSSDAGLNPFASVWLDGQLYGELSSLRDIPAYQVADLRYYDITEAGAKFGLRAGTGGAIEVRSRVK
jgi:hypothetical protein